MVKKDLIKQIEEISKKPIIREPPVEFISTGSIILNLAASQKGRNGGWARGRIINIVGDRSSGKTLVALEACANAYYKMKGNKSHNFAEVKDISLVYNNVEGVMDFPLERMYGEELVRNVEWLNNNKDYQGTCEEFGRDFQNRVIDLKKGEMLLYILDSVDSLSSKAGKERIRKSLKTGKSTDGTYGLELQKYFSNEFFRELTKLTKNKDATLILINQVRENLNAGMFGKKFRRIGGKAMDHYVHQEVWLYQSDKLKIKRTIKGKEREIIFGNKIKAKFEKNKTALPFRTAELQIIYNYGLDDVNSMVDYLFGPGLSIKIDWDGEKFDRDRFADFIDENPEQYNKLVSMTEEVWYEIEKVGETNRKGKYE